MASSTRPLNLTRSDLRASLAANILGRRLEHPTRVAIDGIDTAGKTTLADELAAGLTREGRQVIRAGIDGFHNEKALRRARGPLSPEGYYLDSFNYQALLGYLLQPLGPGGNLTYRTMVFDYRRDAPVTQEDRRTTADAILLFDGVFLFRPELNDFWDYRIYLHISFEEALARAAKRDKDLFADDQQLHEAYHKRYLVGQSIYLRTVSPQSKADAVIDNNDWDHPRLLQIGQHRDLRGPDLAE